MVNFDISGQQFLSNILKYNNSISYINTYYTPNHKHISYVGITGTYIIQSLQLDQTNMSYIAICEHSWL